MKTKLLLLAALFCALCISCNEENNEPEDNLSVTYEKPEVKTIEEKT